MARMRDTFVGIPKRSKDSRNEHISGPYTIISVIMRAESTFPLIALKLVSRFYDGVREKFLTDPLIKSDQISTLEGCLG